MTVDTAVVSTSVIAPPSGAFLAQVRRVRRLTPNMTRVTLHSEALAWFRYEGPDQLVRTFFPRRGQAAPVIPVSERWWPECQALAEDVRPEVRNYTARRFDRERRELDIDFVLHGATGPASRWACQARPGDVLGLLADGAGYAEPADTDWRLLVGDETALPAIGAIIAALPAGARAKVLVEVGDATEEQPLPGVADVDVTWIHRGHGPTGTGEVVLPHLRAAAFPRGRVYAWVAGEAGMVKATRRHLVNDRGVAKKDIYFCGYWLHRRNDTDAFRAALAREAEN